MIRCRAIVLVWSALVLTAAGGLNPGAVFLEIWPSARSTALAGAMTALADDADAAYWNPGGLGFQKSLGLSGNGCNWLPGLYPGMYYLYGSGGYGIRDFPFHGASFNFGLNNTYLTTGKTEVTGSNGEPLGEYTTFDDAFGLHAGLELGDKIGVGMNLKYVYSFLVPDWVWELLPELGITSGGTGQTVALDVGTLFKPVKPISIGVMLANAGPNIAYTSSGESDPLPWMLRLGLCYTPIDVAFPGVSPDRRLARLRLIAEMDKVLVGMFYDQNHNRTSGQSLQYELWEAWKSLGVEATALGVFSFRAGYFEDITGARGGFVVDRGDGNTVHVGLFDYVLGHARGRLTSIGLCAGVGLGWKDFVRLEFSSDGLIYDFPTTNIKAALTVNDLGGLLRELGYR